MERFSPSLSVSDLNLAIALLTAGCLPDPRGFCDKFDAAGGGMAYCHFLPNRISGPPETMALIHGWEHPEEFKARYPEDPFSYMMTFCENRHDAHKAIRGQRAKAILQRGSSLAMVDPESPRAIQEQILQLIGV